MVVTQLMQNGRVEIADVDGITDDVVTEVVSFAVNGSPLNPPPAIHIVKHRG